jgi:hypothetical protein
VRIPSADATECEERRGGRLPSSDAADWKGGGGG